MEKNFLVLRGAE